MRGGVLKSARLVHWLLSSGEEGTPSMSIVSEHGNAGARGRDESDDGVGGEPLEIVLGNVSFVSNALISCNDSSNLSRRQWADPAVNPDCEEERECLDLEVFCDSFDPRDSAPE